MFHVLAISFPLQSLSLYAPFPSDSLTSYGPFDQGAGMPSSVGMTASVSYVSENGVSPLLDLIIVRWAHRTYGSSS
ncbi:hypothetical protein Tco_0342347, partial [Tanacetum coccineum]